MFQSSLAIVGAVLVLAVRLATDPPATDLSVLGQYGAVGLMALLGLLFARTAYKRETDRGDRLEAEVLRLNTFIQDKAVPALVVATEAVSDHTALVRELLGNPRDR